MEATSRSNLIAVLVEADQTLQGGIATGSAIRRGRWESDGKEEKAGTISVLSPHQQQDSKLNMKLLS